MKARLKCNCDIRVCRFVRSTFVALALSFGLDSYAWAGAVLHEDFEDDALGMLDATWTVTSAGGGSVSIVNTTDHGHVLRLQSSSAEGEFLIAARAISSSSTDITTQVDLKSNSGASFIWTLNGAGSSIGRRRIRLQQAPGSTTLVANTVPSGDTSCGTLPSSVFWSKVTLIVHTVPRTFDVLIDGEPTACTGVAAGIQPPFNSVSVMDASNAGWGGTVRFDNIDISTP
jgi:hypothetical protein